MKKMKKLFAVLLTLAMVLGMSMTSFAADETTNATVKISGADGATLTYVQIVEPDRGSEDGWKIVPGFEKAFTDAGLTIKHLLQIHLIQMLLRVKSLAILSLVLF